MRRMPHMLVIFLTLLLCSCANMADLYVKTTDNLGLTPQWDKDIREQQELTRLQQRPFIIPVFKMPAGTKDGLHKTYYPNGALKMQSHIRQGVIDDYVDVYYPNGQLQSHTIVKNGYATGMSHAYYPSGQLKTEIPYWEGKAEGIVKLYNEQGKLIQQVEINLNKE